MENKTDLQLLEEIKEQKRSEALQKILQNGPVQLIAKGDYAGASKLLPTRIENVFGEPKLFELINAVGEVNTKLQIEFELINLASLMSVGGNLNKAQVPFIAEQLINLYPNESIADLKLCFQRGAIGLYGDIQRLDGITIGGWIKLYLEEKYEALEERLMKEKENPYQVPSKTDSQPLEGEEREKMLKQWKESINSLNVKPVLPLTPEEVKREGKEKAVKQQYVPQDESYIEEVLRKGREAQEKTVRELHPEWDEDQVQARLKEIRSKSEVSMPIKIRKL